MDLTKKNNVLVPKQRLFAPMLGTLGGGSIRGFQPLGGGLKYYINEFGTNGNNHFARDVTVDSNDNTIVGGYATALSGGPSGDYGWVTKYTKDGTLDWYRDYYTSAGEYINFRAVGVDSSDNVFTSGYINIGSGNKDVMVGKWNSSGVAQAIKTFGTSGSNSTDEFAYDMVMDSSGRPHIVSNIDVPANLTAISRVANDLSGLSGYSEKNFGISNASVGRGIGYTDVFGGRVLVHGYDENYTSRFSGQVHLLSVGGSFVSQFVLRFGGSTRHTFGYAVAPEQGNGDGVYFGGRTDIGTTSGTAAYLTKWLFNSSGGIDSGGHSWSRLIDSSGSDELWDVVTATDNSVYAVINCAPSGAAGSGNRTAIVKFNSGGTLQWIRLLGISGGQSSDPSITLNSEGDVIISRSYSNASSRDQAFYMLYPADGSITGTFGNWTIEDGSSFFNIVTNETPSYATHNTAFTGSSYSGQYQNANKIQGTTSRFTNENVESIG